MRNSYLYIKIFKTLFSVQSEKWSLTQDNLEDTERVCDQNIHNVFV